MARAAKCARSRNIASTVIAPLAASQHLIQSVIADHLCAAELQEDLLWLIHRMGEQRMNAALTLLPLTVCRAQGGDPARAAPVLATWQLTQLAAKCFDDLEDRQAHPAGWSAARSLNAATALLFVAHLALDRLLEEGVSAETVQRIRVQLDQARLAACAGQHADLAACAGDDSITPAQWLQIAARKSGALLGWAAEAGASVAGADEATCAAWRLYGENLGVLLQVADDYHDLWATPMPHDLLAGTLNLSACYGLTVAQGSEFTALQARLHSAAQGDATAALDALTQLRTLGAQAFTLAAARLQQQHALAALQPLPLGAAQRRHLEALLTMTFPALAHLP